MLPMAWFGPLVEMGYAMYFRFCGCLPVIGLGKAKSDVYDCLVM